jgi:hypothetical protein
MSAPAERHRRNFVPDQLFLSVPAAAGCRDKAVAEGDTVGELMR